jgi:hypothetical protein
MCFILLLYVKGGIMLGLLNYSETTQAPVTENKRGHKKQKRAYFLICDSCFWCATALSLRPIKDELVPKCPMCDDDGL